MVWHDAPGLPEASLAAVTPAARALGDMKVAAAAKPLTKLLENEPNGGVIQQVSLALANLGCADSIPALKGAAKHEDVQTRMWVLQAVGRLGGKRDVLFLAGYLDDPSQSVQASAAQAIEQITGADFGFPKRSGPSSPDEGLRRAMEADPKVLIMGEDVGKLGGVFRITDGLQKDFGEQRVIDTPLAESGIIGTAVGLAIRGYRPVCEIQFDGFVYPAYDQLVSQVAKLHYRMAARRGHSEAIARLESMGAIAVASDPGR